MQKSILDNAIESIQVGVEDFQIGSNARLVSAVRNVYAGVLLLFKHKINQEAPEELKGLILKSKLRFKEIDGQIKITGGPNTVDFHQIVGLFKMMNISINKDNLTPLQQLRNNLEHYYNETVTRDVIKGYLSKVFVLIRDFTDRYLGQNLRDLLGVDTYCILAEINEFYELLKSECNASIETLELHIILKNALYYYECGRCGMDLVKFNNDNDEMCCVYCDEVESFEVAKDRAFYQYSNSLEIPREEYDSLVSCPKCSEESYHWNDKECLLCGASFTQECNLCSKCLTIEEFEKDNTTCEHCICNAGLKETNDLILQ